MAKSIILLLSLGIFKPHPKEYWTDILCFSSMKSYIFELFPNLSSNTIYVWSKQIFNEFSKEDSATLILEYVKKLLSILNFSFLLEENESKSAFLIDIYELQNLLLENININFFLDNKDNFNLDVKDNFVCELKTSYENLLTNNVSLKQKLEQMNKQIIDNISFQEKIICLDDASKFNFKYFKNFSLDVNDLFENKNDNTTSDTFSIVEYLSSFYVLDVDKSKSIQLGENFFEKFKNLKQKIFDQRNFFISIRMKKLFEFFKKKNIKITELYEMERALTKLENKEWEFFKELNES